MVSLAHLDIRHVTRKANVIADTLSHSAVSSCMTRPPHLDYTALAIAQEADMDLQHLHETVCGLQLHHMPVADTTMWCDVSTGWPHPFVPEQWRHMVFSTLHDLVHPSVHATCKLVARCFMWPGMNKDLSTWSQACCRCQLVNVYQHTVAPLGTFQPPTQHFQHVHIDIVGPLPSRDHIYLFTIIDRYTRWPETIPMRDMTTASCVQAFLHSWVRRFGIPVHLTSDRGAQFTSEVWRQMICSLGVNLQQMMAYHPQVNGAVE